MVSGTVSVQSACCSRQWGRGRGTSLGFFECLLCADESDIAVSPIAEGLRHRATAATEGDPGLALRSGFPFSLRNENRICLVVHEVYSAVDSVGTIFADLDGDFCHLYNLVKNVGLTVFSESCDLLRVDRGATRREIDLTNGADVIGEVRDTGYHAVQIGLSYLALLLQIIEPAVRFVCELVTQLLPLHGRYASLSPACGPIRVV